MTTAYCVHCKSKHKVDGETKGKKMKNGAVMVKGKCAKCHGKVATFKKG